MVTTLKKTITPQQWEAMLEVSKSLFTASEALREALDTIDLKSLEEVVLPFEISLMASQQQALEHMAQSFQQKALKKELNPWKKSNQK